MDKIIENLLKTTHRPLSADAFFGAVFNVLSMGVGLEEGVVTNAKGFKQVMKAMATNSVNSLKGGLKGVLYEFGISSVTNFGSNIFSESIARGWFGR